MGMIPNIETTRPTTRAYNDGLIKSLSLETIPQAWARKDQPRLNLCMFNSPDNYID